MPGLSHALVPAQESKRWSFGRLLLLPVIQKGLFLGPKKSRKIRHANTGLPSIFVSRPHKLRFVLVPIRFASEAWPRPGFAELRSATIAVLGNMRSLSTEQKGKDVMTKTRGSFGFVFGT